MKIGRTEGICAVNRTRIYETINFLPCGGNLFIRQKKQGTFVNQSPDGALTPETGNFIIGNVVLEQFPQTPGVVVVSLLG